MKQTAVQIVARAKKTERARLPYVIGQARELMLLKFSTYNKSLVIEILAKFQKLFKF